MTPRSVLAWYLGTLLVLGGAGAGAYQELHRQHAAIGSTDTEAHQVMVAQAVPQMPQMKASEMPTGQAVAPAEPLRRTPMAVALPKLRSHVAVVGKPKPPRHPHAVAAVHPQIHRPTRVAATCMRTEMPAPAATPRMYYTCYTYQWYSPYRSYYGYYPGCLYCRQF